jgi:hypothetical protein
MFKLAVVALPIDAYPYNHDPPMQEHSKCLKVFKSGQFIYLL